MTTIALDGFQLNLGDIKKARKGKITHHQCAVLAGKIKNLSTQVENNWEGFSGPQKEALRALAYELVSPAKPSFWLSLRFTYAIFRAHRDDYYSGILMMADAISELIDNIFSAIEREDLAQAYAESDLFT
jgi:hypothetical protein